jgi:hypothetical protein
MVEAWAMAARAAARDGSIPIALILDERRFDASVVTQALGVLSNTQESMGAPEPVRVLGRSRVRKRGVTANGVRYKCEGEVASGDGDTSSGDEYIHAVAVSAMIDSPGNRQQHWSGGDAAVLSNSDDVVIVTTAAKLAAMGGVAGVESFMAKHNFRAKVRVCKSPEEVEFCSGRFWPTPHGRVFGPKPGRVLAKTFWHLRRLTKSKRRRHIRGVATGLSKICAHVPILRVVMPAILAATRDLGKVPPIYVDRWEGRIRAESEHVADRIPMLDMVDRLYHVSPTQLAETELWLRSVVTDEPVLFDSLVLEQFATVDWK